MSAKTGTTQSGTKRWYSVKITGKIEIFDRFIDSFLESHYGVAFNYVTMPEVQKLALLDEALINDMMSRVANTEKTKALKTSRENESQIIETALSAVEITGVD